MRLIDLVLGLAVATVWGLTFIAIKYGLMDAPPFLLSALRFAFAAFPAMLFMRPPRAQFAKVAAYGLLIGVGQFGLLFLAIRLGMPVGLASLVVQIQVFFTIVMAWAALGEHPTPSADHRQRRRVPAASRRSLRRGSPARSCCRSR